MGYRTRGPIHLGRQGKQVWLIVRRLPMKAGHVCQNLIFMSSLIHKVCFCLANVFLQKCLVVTFNLWLWTDVAVKRAWLFSIISLWHQKITHSHVTLLTLSQTFQKSCVIKILVIFSIPVCKRGSSKLLGKGFLGQCVSILWNLEMNPLRKKWSHIHSVRLNLCRELLPRPFNFFMTDVSIIQKQVHWFGEQMNGLIFIW